MALDEVVAASEVAAPEFVLGELTWDGRQPWKWSCLAVVGLEAAGEDGGDVAGAVATDEHRLVAQHLVRIESVEDDPLELGAEGRPCRAVGDAGDGGIGAGVDLCEPLGSEDGFGGDAERVEIFDACLAQLRDGVAFLAAGAGGRDGGVVALDRTG
jgi:hypothetical protein